MKKTLLIAIAVALLAAPASAQVDLPRYVALGDSLTAGYGLAQADSFPSQLEAALRAAGLRPVEALRYE